MTYLVLFCSQSEIRIYS